MPIKMCEIAANWYEWLQMDRIGSGHNGFKYDRFMCASLCESSCDLLLEIMPQFKDLNFGYFHDKGPK